jgi:hypothetical protein
MNLVLKSCLASSLLVAIACGGGKSEPAAPEPAPAPVADAAPAEPTAEEQAAAAAADAEKLAAAEKTATEAAAPVFEKYCAKCHKTSKKSKKKVLAHFNMDVYPYTTHEGASLTAEVREVLGIGGGKATMPADKPGSVQGEELAAITAWADAYDATHPATPAAAPAAE